MSREIKFRAAIETGDGTWIVRDAKMFGDSWMVDIDGNGVYDAEFVEGDDFIPLQFTGLHDKNGKEIYEGDIVRVSDPSKPYQIQTIVFEDGCFCGYSDKKSCKCTTVDVLIRAHSVEVIGNIHDNPELLEDE